MKFKNCTSVTVLYPKQIKGNSLNTARKLSLTDNKKKWDPSLHLYVSFKHFKKEKNRRNYKNPFYIIYLYYMGI